MTIKRRGADTPAVLLTPKNLSNPDENGQGKEKKKFMLGDGQQQQKNPQRNRRKKTKKKKFKKTMNNSRTLVVCCGGRECTKHADFVTELLQLIKLKAAFQTKYAHMHDQRQWGLLSITANSSHFCFFACEQGIASLSTATHLDVMTLYISLIATFWSWYRPHQTMPEPPEATRL